MDDSPQFDLTTLNEAVCQDFQGEGDENSKKYVDLFLNSANPMDCLIPAFSSDLPIPPLFIILKGTRNYLHSRCDPSFFQSSDAKKQFLDFLNSTLNTLITQNNESNISLILMLNQIYVQVIIGSWPADETILPSLLELANSNPHLIQNIFIIFRYLAEEIIYSSSYSSTKINEIKRSFQHYFSLVFDFLVQLIQSDEQEQDAIEILNFLKSSISYMNISNLISQSNFFQIIIQRAEVQNSLIFPLTELILVITESISQSEIQQVIPFFHLCISIFQTFSESQYESMPNEALVSIFNSLAQFIIRIPDQLSVSDNYDNLNWALHWMLSIIPLSEELFESSLQFLYSFSRDFLEIYIYDDESGYRSIYLEFFNQYFPFLIQHMPIPYQISNGQFYSNTNEDELFKTAQTVLVNLFYIIKEDVLEFIQTLFSSNNPETYELQSRALTYSISALSDFPDLIPDEFWPSIFQYLNLNETSIPHFLWLSSINITFFVNPVNIEVFLQLIFNTLNSNFSETFKENHDLLTVKALALRAFHCFSEINPSPLLPQKLIEIVNSLSIFEKILDFHQYLQYLSIVCKMVYISNNIEIISLILGFIQSKITPLLSQPPNDQFPKLLSFLSSVTNLKNHISPLIQQCIPYFNEIISALITQENLQTNTISLVFAKICQSSIFSFFKSFLSEVVYDETVDTVIQFSVSTIFPHYLEYPRILRVPETISLASTLVSYFPEQTFSLITNFIGLIVQPTLSCIEENSSEDIDEDFPIQISYFFSSVLRYQNNDETNVFFISLDPSIYELIFQSVNFLIHYKSPTVSSHAISVLNHFVIKLHQSEKSEQNLELVKILGFKICELIFHSLITTNLNNGTFDDQVEVLENIFRLKIIQDSIKDMIDLVTGIFSPFINDHVTEVFKLIIALNQMAIHSDHLRFRTFLRDFLVSLNIVIEQDPALYKEEKNNEHLGIGYKTGLFINFGK